VKRSAGGRNSLGVPEEKQSPDRGSNQGLPAKEGLLNLFLQGRVKVCNQITFEECRDLTACNTDTACQLLRCTQHQYFTRQENASPIKSMGTLVEKLLNSIFFSRGSTALEGPWPPHI
jgi:hypothetical protein